MERKYERPRIIFQELQCETVLCSCEITNPNFNTLSQCGYEPEGLGFRIFAMEWVNCDTTSGSEYYCYHTSMMILFES